jgi:hypothetical protein
LARLTGFLITMRERCQRSGRSGGDHHPRERMDAIRLTRLRTHAMDRTQHPAVVMIQSRNGFCISYLQFLDIA